MSDDLKDRCIPSITGNLVIRDPTTGKVFLNKSIKPNKMAEELNKINLGIKNNDK